MRNAIVTVSAIVALVWAAPANAHLITQPKCGTLKCQLRSQQTNLAHVRGVLRATERVPASDLTLEHQREVRFARSAMKWLPREIRETKAAMAPRVSSSPLYQAFMCIHSYEGAWNANTGNGFYGGLQMDWDFMKLYGSEYLYRYGTADKWTPAQQLAVAYKAYHSGRGFYPWPNTARKCGLI